MEEKKLFCFSKCEFDNYCENQGWSPENAPKDSAFISICGTPDCQRYYLEEVEEHYFKSQDNVLNLDFDDISTDSIVWRDHVFYGLSNTQAAQAVKFIENHKDKNFYIHCRAGQSRSQGFVRYIMDMYPNVCWVTRIDNPCKTPNMDVVCKLKERYRLLGYYIRDILADTGYNPYKVEFFDGLGEEDSEYTYSFLPSDESVSIHKIYYFPEENLTQFPLKLILIFNGYRKEVKLFKTLDELILYLETGIKKSPSQKE